jgi:hypothetical protein
LPKEPGSIYPIKERPPAVRRRVRMRVLVVEDDDLVRTVAVERWKRQASK